MEKVGVEKMFGSNHQNRMLYVLGSYSRIHDQKYYIFSARGGVPHPRIDTIQRGEEHLAEHNLFNTPYTRNAGHTSAFRNPSKPIQKVVAWKI